MASSTVPTLSEVDLDKIDISEAKFNPATSKNCANVLAKLSSAGRKGALTFKMYANNEEKTPITAPNGIVIITNEISKQTSHTVFINLNEEVLAAAEELQSTLKRLVLSKWRKTHLKELISEEVDAEAVITKQAEEERRKEHEKLVRAAAKKKSEDPPEYKPKKVKKSPSAKILDNMNAYSELGNGDAEAEEKERLQKEIVEGLSAKYRIKLIRESDEYDSSIALKVSIPNVEKKIIPTKFLLRGKDSKGRTLTVDMHKLVNKNVELVPIINIGAVSITNQFGIKVYTNLSTAVVYDYSEKGVVGAEEIIEESRSGMSESQLKELDRNMRIMAGKSTEEDEDDEDEDEIKDDMKLDTSTETKKKPKSKRGGGESIEALLNANRVGGDGTDSD